MSKLFAVLVEPSGGEGGTALQLPDHNQRQRAWFVKAANEGTLLACGSYTSHDGAGLWLLRAGSREAAEAVVRTSPRFLDGMLSMERTRIVEWVVSIGKERFT